MWNIARVTDGVEKISVLKLSVLALQSNCYWLIIEKASQRHLGVLFMVKSVDG